MTRQKRAHAATNGAAANPFGITLTFVYASGEPEACVLCH
jgi:hypothetical protein